MRCGRCLACIRRRRLRKKGLKGSGAKAPFICSSCFPGINAGLPPNCYARWLTGIFLTKLGNPAKKVDSML